jgi:hypothetical protein
MPNSEITVGRIVVDRLNANHSEWLSVYNFYFYE